MIRRTLDTYEKVVGRPAKAWLSSAIRGTVHTPAFLKEFGLIAYCDYLNDDQPYLIHTSTRARSSACLIPTTSTTSIYSPAAACRRRRDWKRLKICFDQLYSEGAETGRIMNVGLHPHVMGQAHRIGALREFVEYAQSRDKVWFPSREEIARWYMTSPRDAYSELRQ